VRVLPAPCACGCGGHPRRGRFLRGHDRRRLFLEDAPAAPGPAPPHTPVSRRPGSPAYRLLLAVVEEAWDHRETCARRQLGVPCARCEDDRAWARATAASGTFSLFTFVGACEMLGLDEAATRISFLSTALTGPPAR
jgi:hypothetical protein